MRGSARTPSPRVIKDLRKRAGWTQEEAARALRGSLSAYQRQELGKTRMPESTFELMLFKVLAAELTPTLSTTVEEMLEQLTRPC